MFAHLFTCNNFKFWVALIRCWLSCTNSKWFQFQSEDFSINIDHQTHCSLLELTIPKYFTILHTYIHTRTSGLNLLFYSASLMSIPIFDIPINKSPVLALGLLNYKLLQTLWSALFCYVTIFLTTIACYNIICCLCSNYKTI